MRGRDVISILEFTRRELETIFEETDRMLEVAKRGADVLRGKIMATAFFEPSTRTKLSFQAAMLRLGGSYVDLPPEHLSSRAKGESLADTIRMLDAYADVIVVRHRVEGVAKFAAEIADAPVINGGDGTRGHPTQAMVDLYAIRRELGRLDKLVVGVLGDLKYGRAAKSFVLGISKFEPEKLYLISPQILRPKEDLLEYLSKAGVEHEVVEDLRSVLPELDVLYVTRIQRERFPDPLEYERVKGSYRVTADILAEVKDELIVLHPLPRVDELDFSVDSTRHARYFVQASYGVPLRMALLKLVLVGG